ncbi:MAG: VanZ family protein [Chloroflexota bacterium]
MAESPAREPAVKSGGQSRGITKKGHQRGQRSSASRLSLGLIIFMKWVAFLFTLFIIAVIVFADLGILPRFLGWAYNYPNGDKVGHFVLFGLLNFFLTLAFTRSLPNGSRGRVALSTGLILTSLIILEEFSQQWFSSRSFDLIDLLMGCIGVTVGGFVALKINQWRQGQALAQK